MKKIDYKQLARDIVKYVGPRNVNVVTHCMTRLRFTVKNIDVVNQEAIKDLNGILGVVYANDQLMVILGQNLLPVYEAVVKDNDFSVGDVIDEKLDEPKEKKPLTLKRISSAILSLIVSAVTPILPGLIAGGMMKVFLLLVIQFSPDFAATSTYSLLSIIGDAPFYFMPVFIAYGAAQKMGGTPIYSMLCAGALIHGNFIALVTTGAAITLFSIPVKLVSYASSMLPAIFIAVVAYYAEKLFNKIVPGIFKSIFVGFGTVAVTMFLTYTILGPLGSYAGDAISGAFLFLYNLMGPFAVAIFAACVPWLVMCGMHTAFSPLMAQFLANNGFDPIFRTGMLLHNMAEGGAVLGVALRSKNPKFRSEAIGIAVGCIFAGVTEPAIYGINLRYKKPMIGVMAGASAGSFVAGLLGAKAYVMGYSNIFGTIIFQDTIIAIFIGIIISILAAAVVAFILGIDEGSSSTKEIGADEKIEVNNNSTKIVAVADSEMISIETVHDEMFSSKMMGGGVAFELKGDTIVAPCSGKLSVVFHTGHAFGITRLDGVEMLVHIGINTVELEGDGFTILEEEGSKVTAGAPIIKLDLAKLKKSGYDLTTMLVITNAKGKVITFNNYGSKEKGEIINVSDLFI